MYVCTDECMYGGMNEKEGKRMMDKKIMYTPHLYIRPSYTHTYTHIHTYIHTYLPTYIHTYIPTFLQLMHLHRGQFDGTQAIPNKEQSRT